MNTFNVKAALLLCLLSAHSAASASTPEAAQSTLEGAWELDSCDGGKQEAECKGLVFSVVLVQKKEHLCGIFHGTREGSGQVNDGKVQAMLTHYTDAEGYATIGTSMQGHPLALTIEGGRLDWAVLRQAQGEGPLLVRNVWLRRVQGEQSRRKLEEVRATCFPD